MPNITTEQIIFAAIITFLIFLCINAVKGKNHTNKNNESRHDIEDGIRERLWSIFMESIFEVTGSDNFEDAFKFAEDKLQYTEKVYLLIESKLKKYISNANHDDDERSIRFYKDLLSSYYLNQSFFSLDKYIREIIMSGFIEDDEEDENEFHKVIGADSKEEFDEIVKMINDHNTRKDDSNEQTCINIPVSKDNICEQGVVHVESSSK